MSDPVDGCWECKKWIVEGLKWYGRCDEKKSRHYGQLRYKCCGCDQGQLKTREKKGSGNDE